MIHTSTYSTCAERGKQEIIPARRAHAAFSTVSESRELKWPLIALARLDTYFTFSENTARVGRTGPAVVALSWMWLVC